MSFRWKLLVLFVPLLVLVGGCAAALVAGAAAGGTTYAWYKGEARTSLPHDVPTVFKAAERVLEQELKVRILSRRYDATAGVIEAERADGKAIKVSLNLSGERVTNVRVRVGTFGDKKWSNLFLDKLKARL